jgi:hypothetical protein
MSELLVIAGRRLPLMADFAAYASERSNYRPSVVSTSDICPALDHRAATMQLIGPANLDVLFAGQTPASAKLVFFLGRKLNSEEKELIDVLAVAAARTARICIVSSFTVHFGDRQAAEAERHAAERFRNARDRMLILRPGRVLTEKTRRRLSRISFLSPLIPARFRSCCLDPSELFRAIENTLADPRLPQGRIQTILGPNRSWKSWIDENRGQSPAQLILSLFSKILSYLMVGQVIGLFWSALEKILPTLRSWNFETVCPSSTRELLAFYNPHNYRHTKVVGYNNGVVHFGQRYPERTVLSTRRCNGMARVNCQLAKFDCGVTVRQAASVLRSAGKELLVLPNFSYVSLGTGFFVPIHGSASNVNTIGDTIEKVVLYDPVADRIIAAKRVDRAFQDAIYDLDRNLLLLRVYLRVKNQSRYFLKREILANPSSENLIKALSDSMASHVEIRKARASSLSVEVYRYYDQAATDPSALEFPRDSIGKVWDRIEQNPIARPLFHGLMRRLAHHVELFFTPDEFAIFWETHRQLPIAKIQLRWIKRDGRLHSPFRDQDRISADLVMLKKHRPAFENYVNQNFKHVRHNPGKHSM